MYAEKDEKKKMDVWNQYLKLQARERFKPTDIMNTRNKEREFKCDFKSNK